MRAEILTIDIGISPEIALSARFKTVRRWSFPMFPGMSPEIWFPVRSRIRSEEREVMQEGISPEMDFQSAMTMVVSSSSLQISGEMFPVMLLE